MATIIAPKEQLEPAYFFLKLPLYTKIEAPASVINALPYMNSSVSRISFDGYEAGNQFETTFVGESQHTVHYNSGFDYKCVIIECTRSKIHYIFFVLHDKVNNVFMKIGQFPSLATIHTSDIKEYGKIMSNDKRREFTKAIGLAAYGVGIGSFVYLRRIFEDLIFTAYREHPEVADEKTFMGSRMDEKIQLLHDHLPNFLVENKVIYSILSKGIHELDEDTCLAYFDPLRAGIEIILDQKADEQRRQEKLKLAAERVKRIHEAEKGATKSGSA